MFPYFVAVALAAPTPAANESVVKFRTLTAVCDDYAKALAEALGNESLAVGQPSGVRQSHGRSRRDVQPDPGQGGSEQPVLDRDLRRQRREAGGAADSHRGRPRVRETG